MKGTVTILIAFICFFSPACSKKLNVNGPNSKNESGLYITDLKVNYQSEPLGIDSHQVLFSWRMEGQNLLQNVFQKAYRIIVYDDSNSEVWNTGITKSSTSIAIPYDGLPLQPSTRYYWYVTVWGDQEDQELINSSWFETGLMNPDPQLSAWDEATWIGGRNEDMILQSHYLSVFKIEYSLQLDANTNSSKASFILGANDRRLMNKHLNLYKMEVNKNESYIAIELDISGVEVDEKAKLNVYRVGYSPGDRKEKPLTSLEIPASLVNKENMYDAHTLFLDVVYGVLDIFMDGRTANHKVNKSNPGSFSPTGINLNPYGTGGDYICFPLLADVGFQVQSGQKAKFSNLKIRHFREPSNVIFDEKLDGNYDGIFKGQKGMTITDNIYEVGGMDHETIITADPGRNSIPMLRTSFVLEEKNIKKARIYATARGIYELYINGKRIGEDYFNPGLTQYNKHHMYQTYDVTDMLNGKSENVLGAMLSEGWWSGAITFTGSNWNFFGDRQSLLAKMIITYEDNTETIITTNPETWQYYNDGPIKYGSFFQGEVYDAGKETAIDGWNNVDFNDKDWHSAVEVGLEGNAITGDYRDFIGRPKSLNYKDQKLIGQVGGNVTIVKTLVAKSVEEVSPGVFVYDMGQNMVGFPQILLDYPRGGDTILLRYAEVKYPDLEEYNAHSGTIMMENIRAALTQDLYITRTGPQIIQPRFTFHGYRFLEISGLDSPLPVTAVKGKVLSSVENLSAGFESSNPLVNKFWENVTWSLRGNFLSIPTDTPARNERMGWNGDLNVFARTATYLSQSNQFLKRHMMAMRDMQTDNGRFSDVAPIGNGFGGTLWGSAGIIVAWECYQQFGDVTFLEEHYDAMKAYVLFLNNQVNEEGILIEGPLGDWLSPENAKNDNTLLWNAYQVYCLKILENVAKILKKEDDFRMFKPMYDGRKHFFNETYVDPRTHKTIHSGAIVPRFGPPDPTPPKKGDLMDTQASYAIPLAFGIFNEINKPYAIQHLENTIKRKNTDDGGMERPEFSLMTGFIGTASIGDALSQNGKDSIAYKLLQTETYPSWLYPVKNGATTIWERLNSYTHENGFGGNNSMNSFNHYAFGAVVSWMYNYILGIRRDSESPGFHHFYLAPVPDPTKQMTYAKGYYDSMYGRIKSEWKYEGEGVRYYFTIPANTSATVKLSGKKIDTVKVNGTTTNLIYDKSEKEEKFIFTLSSGSYEINVI